MKGNLMMFTTDEIVAYADRHDISFDAAAAQLDDVAARTIAASSHDFDDVEDFDDYCAPVTRSYDVAVDDVVVAQVQHVDISDDPRVDVRTLCAEALQHLAESRADSQQKLAASTSDTMRNYLLGHAEATARAELVVERLASKLLATLSR